MAEGIRMCCGGLVKMSDRILVLTNNRVYRTLCIKRVVNGSIYCCCFDSCYLACDAVLMKIMDMVFRGSISPRRLGGSTLAEGIGMSWDDLVNMSDRIRVLSNNRVYRTECIENTS